MKAWSIFFSFLLIVCLAAAGQPKGMTQEKTMGQQKAMTQEQMMEQMMKYANPVKEHEYLKRYAGSWDVDVKTWENPAAPPMTEKAAMKGEVIFGGRFVRCEFDGTMMGQPFNGLQVIGYDLFQKKFTTFWIDSLSTYFYLTAGTLDSTGNALTETGMWPNPMTGGTSKIKIVTTWLGDGKYRYEMFMTGPDGKEMKRMEINYAKRG